MNTFRGEDHVENNCTLCKHFKSYEDDYCDDMQPSDQGICSKGKKDKQSRSKTEANDKQDLAKDKQTKSKVEGNVNDNVNDNENHNEIFKKLWVNRSWLESLAMLWKREIKEIHEHLNKFRLECISKADYKNTEKDAKEHFVNWTKYNPLPDQGYVYKRPDLSSLERNPF
jgi:hypothetical protein